MNNSIKQNINSTTIVCCVEAGPLEQMTVCMIASLRHFGGELANSHVMAIQARTSLPLSKKTIEAFKKLDVDYISFRSKSLYSWNNFINKPQALLYAEHNSVADTIIWLDSDIIVSGCLSVLILPSQTKQIKADTSHFYDFAACPSDKNIGTSGNNDKNNQFWIQVCTVLGLKIEALPWVTTWSEMVSVRWYFNSGVFSFKNNKGFAELYNNYCHRLLESHIASREAGIFFTDQICLGLTAHSLGLTTKILEHKYNFALGSSEKNINENLLMKSNILHYHDSLWAHEWERTSTLLKMHRKDIYSFLQAFAPLKKEKKLNRRVLLKFLQQYRHWRLQMYLKNCKTF